MRRVGVEVVAQTLDADAREDAEDIALVFVEFWKVLAWIYRGERAGHTLRRLAAEDDQVFAEEGLDACQA